MKKPIIAITTGLEMYTDGLFKGSYKIFAVQNYADSIAAAGGIPVMIPACIPGSDANYVKDIIEIADGLLMTGGNDVDPHLYGENPSPKLGNIAPERDIQDKICLKAATKKGIPVFGICRGMQFMNVFFGGNLYQDLSENPQFTVKHSPIGPLDIPVHSVKCTEGSIIESVLGKTHRVNSAHHQAVKDIAPEFIETAKSPDNLTEAVEHRTNKNIYAVQFHPEMMTKTDPKMLEMFKDFIRRCK